MLERLTHANGIWHSQEHFTYNFLPHCLRGIICRQVCRGVGPCSIFESRWSILMKLSMRTALYHRLNNINNFCMPLIFLQIRHIEVSLIYWLICEWQSSGFSNLLWRRRKLLQSGDRLNALRLKLALCILTGNRLLQWFRTVIKTLHRNHPKSSQAGNPSLHYLEYIVQVYRTYTCYWWTGSLALGKFHLGVFLGSHWWEEFGAIT